MSGEFVGRNPLLDRVTWDRWQQLRKDREMQEMKATQEEIARYRKKRRDDALSINAGLAAKQAIIRLAQAAACEEALDDGSHNEGQLWFLVRALCHEHGHDVDEMIRDGRAFAALL